MPLRIKLHSIPPGLRRPGNLARTARFGKPTRTAAQQTESTSFAPRVILPDPKISEAREALSRAIRERIDDLKRLVSEAAEPAEAEYWQKILWGLEGGHE